MFPYDIEKLKCLRKNATKEVYVTKRNILAGIHELRICHRKVHCPFTFYQQGVFRKSFAHLISVLSAFKCNDLSKTVQILSKKKIKRVQSSWTATTFSVLQELKAFEFGNTAISCLLIFLTTKKANASSLPPLSCEKYLWKLLFQKYGFKIALRNDDVQFFRNRNWSP